MIFHLSDLRATAERRLPGYLEAALSMAHDLGNDQYELTDEQVDMLAQYRKPRGLGDAVKAVIHTAVDMAPISDTTKERIKGCAACAKRAARLNAAIPNINPFDQT